MAVFISKVSDEQKKQPGISTYTLKRMESWGRAPALDLGHGGALELKGAATLDPRAEADAEGGSAVGAGAP